MAVRDFPSNATPKKKVVGTMAEKKEVKPIVDSEVLKRKKTLGEKFKKSFISDESKGVGEYVMKDVAIPYLKNMFSEIVRGSLDMILFGGSSPNLLDTHRRITTNNRGVYNNRTSYSSVYNNTVRSSNAGRVTTQTKPSGFGLDEIVFTNRKDAEKVAEYMLHYLEEYDVFSLAEFFSLCGMESEWTHTKYGWSAPLNISIVQIKGGWTLDLPLPVSL